MDQKKIGFFLKELRKSKNLTQGQLAEHFNISDRTVSRWENGNNMPDLSVLIELADFYGVDIREIMDGERKSEIMNEEEKDKLLLIADYAENEKELLLKRLRIISITGACAMLAGFVILVISDEYSLPVIDYGIGVAFGLAFGALLTAVFYSTGILASIRKYKEKCRYMKVLAAASVIICVVLFVVSIVKSF